MPSKPSPNYEARYPIAQWLDDFREVFESGARLPIENRLPALEEYFYQKYPDDPMAEERIYRLVAACNYLFSHIHAFDSGDAAVVGAKSGIVSDYLIVALYRLFVAEPLYRLTADYPPERILEMVREQKRLNG